MRFTHVLKERRKKFLSVLKVVRNHFWDNPIGRGTRSKISSERVRPLQKLSFAPYYIVCAGVQISANFLDEDLLIIISAITIIVASIIEMRRDREWEEDISSRVTRCETRQDYFEKISDLIQGSSHVNGTESGEK